MPEKKDERCGWGLLPGRMDVQESTVIVDDDLTVMNDFANDFNSTSSFIHIDAAVTRIS